MTETSEEPPLIFYQPEPVDETGAGLRGQWDRINERCNSTYDEQIAARIAASSQRSGCECSSALPDVQFVQCDTSRWEVERPTQKPMTPESFRTAVQLIAYGEHRGFDAVATKAAIDRFLDLRIEQGE